VWPSSRAIAGGSRADVDVLVGLRVEFRPQRDAIAGVDVDDHDGALVGERRLEVGPLRELRCLGIEPSTYVRIAVFGLKPSLRFHSVGSIATPATFCGMPSIGMATRPSR
jgi:hypothetical protein